VAANIQSGQSYVGVSRMLVGCRFYHTRMIMWLF